MLIKALKALVTIGPFVKKWVFSDGNFQTKRAIILLVALVILMFGYHFIPHEMEYIIKSLDEVSDMIGYSMQ